MNAHQEPAYRGTRPPALPHSEAARDAVVLLPLYNAMTADEQDYVIEQLRTITSVPRRARRLHDTRIRPPRRPRLPPSSPAHAQRGRASRIDLGGRVVFTEAATGAYVVTPIMAAMAGTAACTVSPRPRVRQRGRRRRPDLGTARLAGVEDRVEVVNRRHRTASGALTL